MLSGASPTRARISCCSKTPIVTKPSPWAGDRGAAKIRDLAAELARAKGRRMPDVAGAVDLSAYLHGVVSLRIHKTSVRWPTSAGRQVERFVTGMLGVR